MAYGQPGSGKIYTMVGNLQRSDYKGIIPRTFEYLFNKIKSIEVRDNSIKFNIKFAYIEIYMEKIYDLLNTNKNVEIREDSEKRFYIEHCTWRKVENIKGCHKVFEEGEKKRKNRNSHALLIIDVEKKIFTEENRKYRMVRGLLNLVDLAGNEEDNINKNDEGIRLEKKFIKKSLSALEACIKNLGSNESDIPYSNSNLTLYLKESLSGNAKTSLIVTISPSMDDADETYNSLIFGNMEMKGKNYPKINKMPDFQNVDSNQNKELHKLKKENDRLKQECEEADNIIIEKEQKIEKLTKELIKIKDMKEQLEKNIEKLIMENDNLKTNSQINIKKQIIDLLKKQNINVNEINNQSINSLIYTLLEKIGKLQKLYQDKIKDKENNNAIFQIMNYKNHQLNKKYTDTQYELKTMEDKTENLENRLFYLNQNNEELKRQNNELEQKIEELKKNKIIYENEISTIISDKKIKDINLYTSESKLNRVINKASSNQILLNKSINLFLNNLYIYNIFKKNFKKMEIILENDIPSIIQNTYESTMNKAKMRINVIKADLENVDYIKSNYTYQSNEFEDNINKLNELIEQNKNNMIENFIFINKLFNIIINQCEKNDKKVKIINCINTSKNSKMSFYEKNEEKIKGNLIEIISNSLDKFKSIFYINDNRDLERDLQYLEQNAYNLNIFDFFQKVGKIFEAIISKSADFRKQKDLEIENLNDKIVYFLKQIEIYKQNINDRIGNSKNDNEKNALNKILILKEEEIIKLNKKIDELSKNIDSQYIINKSD